MVQLTVPFPPLGPFGCGAASLLAAPLPSIPIGLSGISATASAEAAGWAAEAEVPVLSGVLQLAVTGAWTVDDPV